MHAPTLIETHCLSGCGVIGETTDYDTADALLARHLLDVHATPAPEPVAPVHGPRYVAPAAPTHCPRGDAYRPHLEGCSRMHTLTFELAAKWPSHEGAGHALHCNECGAFLPCQDAIHIAAGLPPRRPFA